MCLHLRRPSRLVLHADTPRSGHAIYLTPSLPRMDTSSNPLLPPSSDYHDDSDACRVVIHVSFRGARARHQLRCRWDRGDHQQRQVLDMYDDSAHSRGRADDKNGSRYVHDTRNVWS